MQDKALRGWLYWRSRPRLVMASLERLKIPRHCNLERLDPGKVRVAAVQVTLELIGSAEEYVVKMARPALCAAEQGAQLVVYPEDIATHLLGLLPGFDQLVNRSHSLDGALRELGGEGLKVADVFALVGPAMRRIYLATFSSLARKLGIYVVAGSAVLPSVESKTKGVYNIAHLFGPDGRLIGRQPKTHLLPLEAAWGLRAGDTLRVFDTSLGRIAMPVCMDATYFETFRILALLGAEIVALPVANPEPYNFWKALRGIWPRVQESQVYGIQSCLVGEFLGLKLTGKSGIFAPLELTDKRDGVIAQIEDPTAEGVVVADLDLVRLRQFRRENPLDAAFNLALYSKYFPGIYYGEHACG